jgi:lysophospholipase L1-like esterase
VHPADGLAGMRKKAGIFIAAGLLFFAFTEFGLRTVFGLGHPLRYAPDPACGYFPLPNQQTRRLRARTMTNDLGMRSPEFSAAKPDGTLRLLFLGDSLTFGTILIDQNQIFVERIRRELAAKLGRPVEELNASANSWAIGNELGFLQSRGTFQSDYLILVLNTGDLNQPFATLSEVQGEPTLLERTAVGEVAAKRWPFRRGKPPAGAGMTVGDNPTAREENLRDLSTIADISRAQGVKFLVVYVPFRGTVGGGVESTPTALLQWAAGERADFLDLTPALAAHEARLVTQQDGVHLNAFGNGVVADALEPYLEKKIQGDSR